MAGVVDDEVVGVRERSLDVVEGADHLGPRRIGQQSNIEAIVAPQEIGHGAGVGHGCPERPERAVRLVPDDERMISTELRPRSRLSDLAQIGRRLPVKHVLFALDNCFSGFAQRRDIVASNTISDLAVLTRQPVVQILTAGTEGQRVIEDGGHGLTALKLATYVQERVILDSAGRQTPQYGKLEGEGEFVFRPPAR